VAPIGFGNNYLASGSGVVHLQRKKKTSKEQQQRKWCGGKGLEFGIERWVFETHRRRIFWYKYRSVGNVAEGRGHQEKCINLIIIKWFKTRKK
jgi:hypothetical protein